MIERILIFDDEEIWGGGWIRNFKREFGCEVDIGETPVVAKELLKHNTYSVAIAEPYSPNSNRMDEHIEFIKTDLKEKGVPVLVVSSQPQEYFEEDKNLIQSRDYQAYLKKPAFTRELYPAIRGLIEN